MRNGYRQPKSKGNKQVQQELSSSLQNLQMGLRIAQMVAQQQNQTIGQIGSDVQRIYGVSQNLDYRTRALLELLSIDGDKLNEIADRMRLEDFNRQSDEEDARLGLILDDEGEVTENSTVILTSTTGLEPDSGIFRTKFHLKDSPLPTLREKLLGLKVGGTFVDKINGVDHTFTVVGLRLSPQKEETDKVEDVSVQQAVDVPESMVETN